jgi:branched-subunit amino acid aminotransferase/4-amino-4-deoxychorismate lyase
MMPLDDRGLLLGDGLFETILARDGELILFDAHIERMQAGCMALGLPAPDMDDARDLCQAMLAESDALTGRFAVRMTLTAGSGGRGLERPAAPEPHIFASVAPSPRPQGPVALVTSDLRRNEGSPSARLKTLSYLDNVLARRLAAPAEALLLNNRGEIACAAAANIFWVRGGKLFTPHRDCGVLDGIMRRQVMAAARVEEVQAPRAMLEGAEAIFLTSSLIGVRPVASLDGASLRTHPMVERLIAALDGVS